MSSQSINTQTIQRWQEQSREILIYNFEQYFYHKNFRIGSGTADQEELDHNMHMYELLCNNNCEVYNYVYDKFAGKLEENCPKKKKSVSEIIEIFNRQNNVGNINIDTRNFWSLSQW